MKRMYLLLAGAVFLCACASPRAAYKAGFNFSGVKTVRIGQFSPVGNEPNSGAVVANEFIRQLLADGYNVKVSDTEAADVVLLGTVNEYQPTRRYLINTAQNNGTQQVVVMQQPVELGGSNAYNIGSAFGFGDENKILVSNATVGISAFMKDIRTGEIIWSNSYTYEGLDLNTALDGVVRYLLRSLPRQ